MRNAKTNATLKRPVNKLFTVENTYHETNQTEQKLRWETVIIGEIRKTIWMLTTWTLGGEESLNVTNIYLLIRFNKTREIFPSFTRALSILITTSATSVERANSKELVPKVSGSSTAASYAQRWGLCRNNPANV